MEQTKESVAKLEQSASRKTFRIPVSTGIFEHYPKIGEAIWLLLFYVDRTTEEIPAPDGRCIGRVLGGCPMRDAEVAKAFCCSTKTVRRWRRRLASHRYINARLTPFGTVVEIINSQKWPVAGVDKYVHTHGPSNGPYMAPNGAQMGRPVDTNGQRYARNGKNKEDKTETIQKQDRERNAAGAAPTPLNTSCSMQTYMQQHSAPRKAVKQTDFVSLKEALELVRKYRAEFNARHP